jgi:hypothetical protein
MTAAKDFEVFMNASVRRVEAGSSRFSLVNARWTVAGAMLTACVAHFGGPTVTRWVTATRGKNISHVPVIPRRDECLKPPFTLSSTASVTLSGMRVEARESNSAREMIFISAGGGAMSKDAAMTFEQSHREQLRALPGVESTGLTGCSVRSGPAPCIELKISLCEMNVEELAAALSALAIKQNQQLIFHVSLEGAVGPRCEAADPRCVPQPYANASYDPAAPRGLLSPTSEEPDDCEHDGECARSACGDMCTSWSGAHRTGACKDNPALTDAFCGCVEGHCRWFVQ